MDLRRSDAPDSGLGHQSRYASITLVTVDRLKSRRRAVLFGARPSRTPGPSRDGCKRAGLGCSTQEDCRLLRDKNLRQLLLAQHGWDDERVRELLRRLIKETDIPDGTRPVDLTIHDVMDRRRDGARLIHLLHLLETALAPRDVASAIDRGYANPLRTTSRQ